MLSKKKSWPTSIEYPPIFLQSLYNLFVQPNTLHVSKRAKEMFCYLASNSILFYQVNLHDWVYNYLTLLHIIFQSRDSFSFFTFLKFHIFFSVFHLSSDFTFHITVFALFAFWIVQRTCLFHLTSIFSSKYKVHFKVDTTRFMTRESQEINKLMRKNENEEEKNPFRPI